MAFFFLATLVLLVLDRNFSHSLVADLDLKILVCRYGDGEPTDNAARFYKWFTEVSLSFSFSCF